MNNIINNMEEICLALEKQQLKEPNIDFDGQDLIEKCPTCHEQVIKYEHHCKCGQALYWDRIMTNFDYIKQMNIQSMAFALMMIKTGSQHIESIEDFINWLESSMKEGHAKYQLRL